MGSSPITSANNGSMAELVDARDLKSRARKGVRVRLPVEPPEYMYND